MTSSEFKKWLDTTPAGGKVVYFTGLLMCARQSDVQLNRLANSVWQAAGLRWAINARPTAKKGCTDQWQHSGTAERRVRLTQRRLSDPLGCEYIATKL